MHYLLHASTATPSLTTRKPSAAPSPRSLAGQMLSKEKRKESHGKQIIANYENNGQAKQLKTTSTRGKVQETCVEDYKLRSDAKLRPTGGHDLARKAATAAAPAVQAIDAEENITYLSR